MKDLLKVYVHLEGESFGIGGLQSAVSNQREAIRRSKDMELVDSPFKADVLHINNIGPFSNILASLKKFKDLKIIFHAHSITDSIIGGYPFLERFSDQIDKFLEFTYNRGNLVLVPSEYTKKRISDFVEVPIRIISNGINIEKFESLPDKESVKKKYDLKGKVACAVGNIFKRKGIDDFAELAENLPEVEFVWFGPIPKTAGKEIKNIINNSSKNLHFTGKVDNILEAYAAADLFVYPSNHENQGIVVMEAASSELPIVLKNLDSYDWIEDGRECLKSDNLEEMISNVRELLEDKEKRERLSRNARKLIEKHSLDNIKNRLYEVYMEAYK